MIPLIVFEAARLLRDEAQIHFLLSGWGLGFETLKQLQAEARLPNVTLVDRVADDELEAVPVGCRYLAHPLPGECRWCIGAQPVL